MGAIEPLRKIRGVGVGKTAPAAGTDGDGADDGPDLEILGGLNVIIF